MGLSPGRENAHCHGVWNRPTSAQSGRNDAMRSVARKTESQFPLISADSLLPTSALRRTQHMSSSPNSTSNRCTRAHKSETRPDRLHAGPAEHAAAAIPIYPGLAGLQPRAWPSDDCPCAEPRIHRSVHAPVRSSTQTTFLLQPRKCFRARFAAEARYALAASARCTRHRPRSMQTAVGIPPYRAQGGSMGRGPPPLQLSHSG
ncbi:hypothetical protein C8Q72DRAFT_323299 [Fomitopsis betulina]|nr:hypothetical protein C8Q72DRAFT_323299 [Fomitopsis betulina]